jgi:3'-5' exoribonuclease
MNDGEMPVMKVPELSGLDSGGEAVSFAALTQKHRGTTKYGSPYWKCVFQDRHGTRDFMIWSDEPIQGQAETWLEGGIFRLRVRARSTQRGIELKIIEARVAAADDTGFNAGDLYEVSRFNSDECSQAILRIADENIRDPYLGRLVKTILANHDEALRRHPAARSMHHAFTGGLLEHIRSIAGLCAYLARHYAKYYDELDPPLNKDLIVAAGILHDIGKLFELEYHPVAARYTIAGNLIGHNIIGRDMVRQTASTIEGFPEETLLQLEHAILAHHGRREYGAPVLPQTLEALIVSYADELDAKINQAARARIRSTGDESFTEEIFVGSERRRVYRGRQNHPMDDHSQVKAPEPN